MFYQSSFLAAIITINVCLCLVLPIVSGEPLRGSVKPKRGSKIERCRVRVSHFLVISTTLYALHNGGKYEVKHTWRWLKGSRGSVDGRSICTGRHAEAARLMRANT